MKTVRGYGLFLSIVLCTVLAGAGLARAQSLALEVHGTPDPVRPGQRVVYTLQVSNTSATTPSGAFWINVNLPQHATVDERPGSYSATGNRYGSIVYYQLESLPPGEQVQRQITLLVDNTAQNPPPPDGTQISLSAQLTANDVNIGSLVTAHVVVRALPPGVDLALKADRGRWPAGAQQSVDVYFANTSDNARPLLLRTTLPNGTSLVSAAQGGSAAGNVVTWELGTVPAHTHGRRRLVFAVNGNVATGSLLRLASELRETAGGATLIGHTFVGHVAVTSLEIAIAGAPDPILPGKDIVYRIQVSNRHATTPSEAGWALVQLPKLATVVRRPGSYSATGDRFGSLVWYQLPSIAPGDSLVYQLVVGIDNTAQLPPPPFGTLISANAWLYDQAPQAVSAVVAVGTGDKLDLAFKGAPSLVAAGQELVYTATFGNTGDSDAAARLRVRTPLGTSFVSATEGGMLDGDSVVWELGALRAHHHGARTATFRVDASTGAGTLIQAEGELLDGSGRSLVRRANVAKVAAPEPATLAFTASRQTALGGDTIIYQLTYTNTSTTTPSATQWLAVSLPEYTSVSMRPGSYSATGDRFGSLVYYQLPTLAAGASSSYQLTLTVDSSSAHPPPALGEILVADAYVESLRVETHTPVGSNVQVYVPDAGPGSSADDGGVDGSTDGTGSDAGADGSTAGSDAGQSGTTGDDAGSSKPSDDGDPDAGTAGGGGKGNGGGKGGGCSVASSSPSVLPALLTCLLAALWLLRRRLPRSRA